MATSCEELTHWKRPWCWEGLGAGGEGDDRGCDGWMASLARWTWVLSELRELVMDREAWHARFMGSQRVRHDWATELNWTEYFIVYMYNNFFIHSSVNGHLSLFHVWATVNSAAVNIMVHVSFSILVSLGYMIISGIVGSYGSFIPSFFKKSLYCSP